MKLTTFFKGVLVTDLNDFYVPGSVTTDIREALVWQQRIQSNKKRGAAKHVRHGKSNDTTFPMTLVIFFLPRNFKEAE